LSFRAVDMVLELPGEGWRCCNSGGYADVFLCAALSPIVPIVGHLNIGHDAHSGRLVAYSEFSEKSGRNPGRGALPFAQQRVRISKISSSPGL